jgi:hypothetical protein
LTSFRPRSPAANRRFRALAARGCYALFAATLLAAVPGRAQPEDSGLPSEEDETRHEHLFTLAEAGYALAIGSKLGALPQIECFRDLPGSWQAGIQARIAPQGAGTGYDYLPLTTLAVRKLWLGDEASEPIRNSEYFGLALGAYFGYDFGGKRDGLRPMGSVSLGKFWMPFAARPIGLDLSLDLTTLKLPFFASGHLAGSSDQVIVTCGANLFYAIP